MIKYLFLILFAFATVGLKAQTTILDTSIYTGVEVLPDYPGGMRAFYKFFSAYSHYPDKEKKDRVQGRVIAQFIVEKDGLLSNIKIVRTPSEGLGKEVARVLAMCPKWTPGKQGSKDVRVLFSLPINFKLKD
jgi:TonB family protein